MVWLRYLFPAPLLILAVAAPAAAHEEKAGAITLVHPWSRPAPQGHNGVIYVRIVNEGATGDRLISARSPVAERAVLHRSTMKDGVHRMAEIDGVVVPAGGAAVLEPGGLHLMLIGLRTTLMAEETLPVTFIFESAGTIMTTFAVEARAGGGAGDDHAGHGGD